MKYISFTFNPIQENTYLLWDEATLEAAIVDTGCWNRQEEQLLEGSIKAHGLKLKYALQTHAHFDHTFGLPFIHRTYGLKPVFHINEAETYKQMPQMAAFYVPSDGLLLCGDTLFQGSIGRTDLPGGSFDAEIDSIKNKLLRLPDETTVLCGHGPTTTIGYEKQNNYYF